MYRSLQTGRAAAALLVCLYHTMGCIANPRYFNTPALSAPFSWGMLAVEYFFVLSGFILLTVHAPDIGKPDRFIPYLVKRASRIYPTYLIIALAVFGAAIALPATRDSVPHDPVVVLKRLLLLPLKVDGFPTDGPANRILAVAWSLEYEVCFYTVFALLLLGRAGLWIVVALFAWGFGSLIFHLPLPYLGRYLFGPDTLAFLMGLVAAAIHRTGFRVPRPTWVVPTCVVLIFLLQGDLLRPYWKSDYIRMSFTAPTSALLILALTASEEKGWIPGRHPFIQTLGDASYALYLLHYPMVSVLTRIAVGLGLARFGFWGAALALVLEVAICVATAMAFHLWIEKPILNWLRQKTRPLTTPSTPSTPSTP